MPLASDSDCLPITVEAETDDGTIVNVAIADSEVMTEQIQCVATLDLYSCSIVYASNLVTQNTRAGKSYDVLNKVQHAKSVHVPNIISIWIIKNEINHVSFVGRRSPVEEVSYCFIPNNFENEYKKFVSLHSRHSGK